MRDVDVGVHVHVQCVCGPVMCGPVILAHACMRMCRADVEVYCKSRCVYMCDVVEEAPSASSSQAPASASSVTSSPQAADPLNALSGRKRCVCVCECVCV